VFGARRPSRILFTILFYEALEPFLVLPGAAEHAIDRIGRIATIVTTSWLFMSMLGVGTAWASRFLAEDAAAELRNRGLRTQLSLLQRIANVLIAVIGGAVVLIQFELVRSVGVSLLALAGLAGVVLGFALQKSLSGIVAGIQVSLTQPFRLGDVV